MYIINIGSQKPEIKSVIKILNIKQMPPIKFKTKH